MTKRWFRLSGRTGMVSISASVGPDWCSSKNYVGEVTTESAPLVVAAPFLLEACEEALIFLNDGTPESDLSPHERAVRKVLEDAIRRAKI